jgi:hypothetical protein
MNRLFEKYGDIFAGFVIGAGLVETTTALTSYQPSAALGIAALVVGTIYLWMSKTQNEG